MPEWEDEVFLLRARAFGDAHAIVDVFGRVTGRSSGLVHGGRSRARRGGLQPGNTLAVRWRGRLAEHLGHFAPIEPIKERAARYFSDPLALAAMAAALALVAEAVPERLVKTDLYERMETLFDALTDSSAWPRLFVLWEIDLLASLGFGLTLDRCALTGCCQSLSYVSPRSGRAVSTQAGAPWKGRLLPLPRFIADRAQVNADPRDVAAGFALSGHFLARSVFGAINQPIPAARAAMLSRLTRAGWLDTSQSYETQYA